MTRFSAETLPRRRLPPATTLFRPGDIAQGFVFVWSGRIEVRLISASGREILLYAVEPGQSCIQTTLGLMGGEAYTGEAVTVGEVEVSLLPRAEFLRLIEEDSAFRGDVLRAFGRRMADLTRVLEHVAFDRIDQRLACALMALQRNGQVIGTQAELAARIGSAREVVTRGLHVFAEAGLIRTGRGRVEILDPAALAALCDDVTDGGGERG